VYRNQNVRYTASQIPGPGEYAIPSPSRSTGSFSTAHPKSALDVLMDQVNGGCWVGGWAIRGGCWVGGDVLYFYSTDL